LSLLVVFESASLFVSIVGESSDLRGTNEFSLSMNSGASDVFFATENVHGKTGFLDTNFVRNSRALEQTDDFGVSYARDISSVWNRSPNPFIPSERDSVSNFLMGSYLIDASLTFVSTNCMGYLFKSELNISTILRRSDSFSGSSFLPVSNDFGVTYFVGSDRVTRNDSDFKPSKFESTSVMDHSIGLKDSAIAAQSSDVDLSPNIQESRVLNLSRIGDVETGSFPFVSAPWLSDLPYLQGSDTASTSIGLFIGAAAAVLFLIGLILIIFVFRRHSPQTELSHDLEYPVETEFTEEPETENQSKDETFDDLEFGDFMHTQSTPLSLMEDFAEDFEEMQNPFLV
jgi:hypothetical protein